MKLKKAFSKMGLTVSFREEAYVTLFSILDFLEEKWGKFYAEKLLANIYKKIDLISTQPLFYEEISILGLRKATVSRYTSLIYQVKKDHIRIIFFLDNRQEPLINR